MELFENTFSAGLDQDTEFRLVPNNKYVDAENITILNTSEYGNVNPMPGTINIGDVYSAPSGVLARPIRIVPTPIITSDGEVDGLVVFVAIVNSSNEFELIVRAVEIQEPTTTINASKVITERKGSEVEVKNVTTLFNKNYGDYTSQQDFLDEKFFRGHIDYVLFKEQNVPVIYYTTGAEPLRRIICDLTNTNIPYTEEETLAQDSGIGSTPSIVVTTDTTLNGDPITSDKVLCGTYQAAVRFINSSTNQFTKWSLLTNPVSASADLDSGSTLGNSGFVGETSDKRLYIIVNTTSINTDSYDQYQLAVVENTDGTGIPKLTANLTPPQTIESPNSIYFYNNNDFESQISIDDIVVDDAPIVACNTVTIKNNRLIQGGLEYRDFDFDRGEPEIDSSGTFLQYNTSSANPRTYIRDEDLELTRWSYFRGELYRFGVVYHDEYGNWSPVHVIDMSTALSNAAANGSIDYKIPAMSEIPMFQGDELRRIAFRISLRNHPTWAKGMAIVRAKRIKDIQFQTPVIPTRFVQSPYATTDYPNFAFPVSNEDAQVGNILGTMIPKDYTNIYPVNFVQEGESGSTIRYTQTDVTYEVPSGNSGGRNRPSGVSAGKFIHVVFNPNNLYNFNNATYEPYTFDGNDKLQVVDTAYINGSYEALDGYSSDYFGGFDPEASEASAWIEEPSRRYYYSSSIPTLQSRNIVDDNYEIKEYQEVVYAQDRILLNKAPGGLLSLSFGDYGGLEASGADIFHEPFNQAMSVLVTNTELEDPCFFFNDDKVVTADKSTRYNINGKEVQNGSQTEDPVTFTNVPTDLRTFSEGSSARASVGRTTGAVHIANVVRGLSDFRYGDRNTQHEFVFTGTYRSLSQAEIDGNSFIPLNVRGGDCIMSPHTFKISDSGFIPAGSTNDDFSGTEQDAVDKYNQSFRVVTNTNLEYSRPLTQVAKAQTITVFLESEIDGSKIAHTEHSSRRELFNAAAPFPKGSGEAKSPFTYTYNLDYSIPNNNKVFFPELRDGENNNTFLSRLAYSDPKIYNTRDNGFSRFRVLNILDLDEGFGPVHKLDLIADRLLCWQRQALSYVPTDSNVIEQSDASILAVRTDEFLNIPQYISNTVGCTNPHTVAKSDTGAYFLDDYNKHIMHVAYNNGFQLNNISDIGNSSWFETKFKHRGFIPYACSGYYDFERNEYVFLSGIGYSEPSTYRYNPFGMIFSERIGAWETKIYVGEHRQSTGDGIEDPATVYTVYGAMIVTDDMSLHQANIRNESTYIGFARDPYVRFSINPHSNMSKVYDVFTVNSSKKPEQVSIYTSYKLNDELYRQMFEQTSMNVADIIERENTYRVPILRDSNGGRVRGNWAVGEIKFDNVFNNLGGTEDNRDVLNSVVTRYRMSEKKI